MKVLFSPCHYVYDEISGGSEFSWAFNIAHKVACKNNDSIVVTGFAKLESEKSYKIVELQKRSDFIDVSVKNAIHFNWQYSIETVRQLRHNSFDIVHHVLPFYIGATFNLAAVFGFVKVPFVLGPIQSALTYQDTDINPSNIRNTQVFKKKIDFLQITYKSFSFVLRFLSKLTLKRVQKIVVINNYTRSILLSQGVSEKKLVIISPGIDVNRFSFSSLSVKGSDLIEFISVGYLLQRKGVDVLIQALKEVVIGNKGVRLRIIGDGPQRVALENLAEELNVSEYVVFEGFVPNSDVQKYYQKAHIFVSMSRSESWGQMYLEAMACGLPVISSRNVGSESIIHEGEFGYLVEQEDVQALAERMIYLIEHPDVIVSFGEKARQEVEEKYDWDKVIIPQYLELYNEMKK